MRKSGIYRGTGPLSQVPDNKLESVIEKYKKLLQKAGEEITENMQISENTQKELEKPLIPYETYLEMTNNHFKNLLKGIS